MTSQLVYAAEELLFRNFMSFAVPRVKHLIKLFGLFGNHHKVRQVRPAISNVVINMDNEWRLQRIE